MLFRSGLAAPSSGPAAGPASWASAGAETRLSATANEAAPALSQLRLVRLEVFTCVPFLWSRRVVTAADPSLGVISTPAPGRASLERAAVQHSCKADVQIRPHETVTVVAFVQHTQCIMLLTRRAWLRSRREPCRRRSTVHSLSRARMRLRCICATANKEQHRTLNRSFTPGGALFILYHIPSDGWGTSTVDAQRSRSRAARNLAI